MYIFKNAAERTRHYGLLAAGFSMRDADLVIEGERDAARQAHYSRLRAWNARACQMREYIAAGRSYADIAKEFGVSSTRVRHIVQHVGLGPRQRTLLF